MSAHEDLISAIKAGDVDNVKSLLRKDPSLAMGGAQPPLLIATYWRSPEIVRLLRIAGAVPTVAEAAALGDEDTLRAVLAAEPARVHERSPDGWTPLHLAAHFGHVRAIDLLVTRGADVRARSTNDLANTALHAALAGHAVDAARALLKRGADAGARDAQGNAPLHLAAQAGNAEAVELLLAHGASPNVQSSNGKSPVAVAREAKHEAVVALLVRRGAKA